MKYCGCFLEYTKVRIQIIVNNSCQIKLDIKLKERFFNTYKLDSHENSMFISLLQKDVYPY